MIFSVPTSHIDVRPYQILDLEFLIASRMSLVVARVLIPEILKGDFWISNFEKFKAIGLA
jgi:hypothetical protein